MTRGCWVVRVYDLATDELKREFELSPFGSNPICVADGCEFVVDFDAEPSQHKTTRDDPGTTP